MRNSIFSSCLFISLALIGCSKEVKNKPLPPSVEEQYLTSNQEIGEMLDALNNRDVPIVEKREILCKTYPEVYKNYYMPALIKLSPDQYTEEILLRDFEAVIKFYKQAWFIKCI
ncbi:hypothetical protein [Acinetobacter sp. V115_6]|uniref:hypothetical protein n=1 Tax=Acinetobacter sp. V115_6 TaxID=3072987 RepID=UPI00287F37C4|nr:hypothetical protein [Acinetobacter sp. V115_6]MDS7927511.1 hypothetical protein [Acinetobacter sp. V115_6]